LRDRKEKQKLNQEREAKEKQERLEREVLRQKGVFQWNSNDLKNKKITYDHNGKLIMIKTISEKK
jgi:hypothetical protein